VATAAAQIMKYWNHPAAGQGSTAYSWWNGSIWQTLSRDFSLSTYDWNVMKNNHTTSDTAAEKDAVARLMSDVGMAFQMDYGLSSAGGSAAYTLYGTTVFPTYFGYANTIRAVYRTSYPSDSAWMQVFKTEIQNGRPSQLKIRDPNAGGHSVVVDGYRDSPSEQVHINLGWGGAYDGWYVTNNIVTGGYSWSDVNYQAAVIGIAPSVSQAPARVTDPAWQLAASADFNQDGHPDLLWRHATTGDLGVWLMQGTTSTGGASIGRVTDPAWQLAASADFNQDGHPDLLWRHATTGDLGVWLMQGTTSTGGAPLTRVVRP
jgi:hypothetical protein